MEKEKEYLFIYDHGQKRFDVSLVPASDETAVTLIMRAVLNSFRGMKVYHVILSEEDAGYFNEELKNGNDKNAEDLLEFGREYKRELKRI